MPAAVLRAMPLASRNFGLVGRIVVGRISSWIDARAPRQPSCLMTSDTPIHLIWHGRFGERRWIEFLLSPLSVIHSGAEAAVDDAQSPVIHAVSTGNKGLPKDSGTSQRIRADIDAGKKVGLIHLSDEWFRCDTSWYQGAAFVLKFYYCSFISHPAIKYLPLGCPEHMATPERIRPASERGLLWSFCGQRKYSRVEMLAALEAVKPHKYPQEYISSEEYEGMVNDTVFAPCPMGNTTPDTWRLYESLEAGCIPVVEKRWTIDYFGRLFPDGCPIPRFQSWAAAARWVQAQSGEERDRLQREIQHWWTSEKAKLREQVSQFVAERFAQHPAGSLVDWTPPYKGAMHSLRWMAELCRYTTPQALIARILKYVGWSSFARRR